MQGYTDTPIDAIARDELKVTVYIDSLSEFIVECSTPMTIAIQGDWGSGKTSMMNMIRGHIESKVVPIWFNTWQYSQFNMDSYLSISLLTNFLEKIGADKEVQNTLNAIRSALKFSAVAATEKFIGSTAANNLNDSLSTTSGDVAKNLETLKEKITTAVDNKLKTGKKDRVVVFIDDLDRLAPEKAVELLEVLKIFMDVPKCVFVLAVDYGVITQGLIKKFGEQVGHSKGKSFFDKIIQLPFSVPTAQYDISAYISNLLTNIKITCDEKETKKYQNAVDYSIGCNPRSLKRIFNSFILLNKVAARKDLFKDATVPIQQAKQRILFATLCLQMAFPDLYNFMIQNKDDLDDGFFTDIRSLDTTEANEVVNAFKTTLFNKGALDNDDDWKAYRNSISRFMKVFYDCLQLDDDLGNLSNAELDNLKSILTFSAITGPTPPPKHPEPEGTTRDLYTEFWQQLLPAIKIRTPLFQKNNRSSNNWISTTINGNKYELDIAVSHEPECWFRVTSPKVSEGLWEFKADIERESGKNWEWLGNMQQCRIRARMPDVKITNKSDWSTINEFLITEINLMYKTLQPYLDRIARV